MFIKPCNLCLFDNITNRSRLSYRHPKTDIQQAEKPQDYVSTALYFHISVSLQNCTLKAEGRGKARNTLKAAKRIPWKSRNK